MAPLERIENVAIVGASGRVGKHFAEEVLKTGKHTVTAITRTDSKGPFLEGIKVAYVDYSSEDSLVPALKGQDFLVITMSVFAPEDTHSKIVKAAAKAGVSYVMPNSYGFDQFSKSLREAYPFPVTVPQHCEEIESLGMSHVAMVCGFWYEWSLALGDPWFAIGIKDQKAVFFDDGKTVINVSTWQQCARALAAFVSLPINQLNQWKNKQLYVASFKVSQRDMLDSVHRVKGTTDADWQITYEPSKQRIQNGLEQLKKGDRRGFAKAMYTSTMSPEAGANFEDTVRGLDNEALKLPKEDLDEATKRAVDMVESGWSPFAGTALGG